MAEDKRQACIDAGMQDMLTKPLTMATAQHLLEHYLGERILSEIKEPSVVSTSSIIDLEDGINIVGGDVEAAKEVLSMLANTINDDFKDIKKAYENKNYDELYQLVHKFYGGLCYCGVPRLREITKQLKEALIEKKLSELTELMKVLSH